MTRPYRTAATYERAKRLARPIESYGYWEWREHWKVRPTSKDQDTHNIYTDQTETD